MKGIHVYGVFPAGNAESKNLWLLIAYLISIFRKDTPLISSLLIVLLQCNIL